MEFFYKYDKTINSFSCKISSVSPPPAVDVVSRCQILLCIRACSIPSLSTAFGRKNRTCASFSVEKLSRTTLSRYPPSACQVIKCLPRGDARVVCGAPRLARRLGRNNLLLLMLPSRKQHTPWYCWPRPQNTPAGQGRHHPSMRPASTAVHLNIKR